MATRRIKSHRELEVYAAYDNILGKLVTMIRHPEQWTIG